jgi:ATP-dependent Lon protease
VVDKIKLPIFPLPATHLFPGLYLPLHIFEDRFKALLQYVEENKCSLAISYSPEFKPGQLFPSRVCGAGPVQIVKRYDSGEMDILVLGTQRIKFKKFVQEVPFLIGEGEVLKTESDMPTKTHDALVNDIRQILINWFFTNMNDSERPIHFFKNVTDLELLTHFVANYFVTDLEQKQMILEDNSLESRAQIAWQVIKDITSQDPVSSGPSAEVLNFPGTDPNKKPSMN